METVPNTFPSLFWGYTAIWVFVVAYLFLVGRRLTRIERKLKTKREFN